MKSSIVPSREQIVAVLLPFYYSYDVLSPTWRMMSRESGSLDHFTWISMLSTIRRCRPLLQTTVMNLLSRRRRVLSICIHLLLAMIQRNDVVDPVRLCARLLWMEGHCLEQLLSRGDST